MDSTIFPLNLFRWFHFFFGVMWIGILYYFNFVQVQALAQANAAADGSAKGITKFVAPRALQFFRWSALGTWIFGAGLLGPHLVSAFALSPPFTGIGVGAWLGTLMAINVWAIIYPNNMRALGFVEGLTDEQKAKSRRLAFLMSRTNTMLSIPMLFFMAFGFTHRAVVGL
jgi:uncharacterized membrane protein